MAEFRYLLYRTDFGNTIIDESPNSFAPLAGNEGEIFTDYAIPDIQPLYLYRESGGTVVENTETNIANWLDEITIITPDTLVDYDTFTGYTATTQIEIDDKIDKVTGATTGNVPIFTSGGGLEDSGYDIADLTGSTGGVSESTFTTYTASTDTRLDGIEADVVYLSGETSGNTQAILDNDADIQYISGVTSGNTEDIQYISGATSGFTADIQYISGVTSGNTEDIQYISGETAANDADITYISGVTDTKVDNTIFDTYTGDTRTELDLTITGATNGLTKVDRDVRLGGTLNQNTTINGDGFNLNISSLNQFNLIFTGESTITDDGSVGGLKYAADYSSNYTNRSLVDKGYVDSVASGLDAKESARLATTTGSTDIDLTGGTFGGTIDGVTVNDGDRILIKNQDSNQEDNGIYVYSSGSNTFVRADDFDGSPSGEVTAGAYVFIEEGTNNANSGWILSTNNPITIDATPLVFVIFSRRDALQAGNGIDITNNTASFAGSDVDGNFLSWDGTQLNVTGVTSQSDFNSYTAATDNRLDTIEADIQYLSGITSGQTTDINYISGQTSGATADIQYLSAITSGNTVDIQTVSAATDTNATDIQYLSGETSGNTQAILDNDADIQYLSGVTSGNTEDINYISGVTDTKLNQSVFTGYTATTVSDTIFVTHTGGTDVNVVSPVAITWDSGSTFNTATYDFSGTSTIRILQAGEYELNYNLPIVNTDSKTKSIGSNLVINNDVIPNITTSAASIDSNSGSAASLVLSTVYYTFTANDIVELAAFRNGPNSGTVNTGEYGTMTIKKRGTLI